MGNHLNMAEETNKERLNLNPYMSLEERLKKHEIAVKKEFLKEIFADQEEHKRSRPPAEETPKKKSRYSKAAKRDRRKQKHKDLFQGKGICRPVFSGEECTQDPCKYSHDVDEYLKQKPDDIGDSCYVYQQTGKCTFGYRCIFGDSHIKDGKLLVDEEKFNSITEPVLNVMDRAIQSGLRKKEIPFMKTKKAIKKYANGNMGFLSDVKDIDMSNIVLEDKPKKTMDWQDKLILAPLTTIGNLPFRRICKIYGADVTVGEMALSTQILKGSPSEWALVKRHKSEDIFGVQLAGSHANTMAACAELLCDTTDINFIDINCGCPIDIICDKGACSNLLLRKNRLESICRSMIDVMDVPLSIKIRTGVQDKNNVAHTIVPDLKDWGVSAVTLHGRSKEQRYTKLADLAYMKQCSELSSVPFISNGDVYSWQDAATLKEQSSSNSVMIARGAIIKPWIFKEIKEQKEYDISGSERFDMIKDFIDFGLEHWGTDQAGIDNVRHFFLNWMSFLCRYTPIGIIEHLPVAINHRPPAFFGRDDRETLLSSTYVNDWIKISEMFLGPVPDGFTFVPKHKANSYPTI